MPAENRLTRPLSTPTSPNRRSLLLLSRFRAGVQFEGSNEVGVFAKLTNAYCLVALGGRPKI